MDGQSQCWFKEGIGCKKWTNGWTLEHICTFLHGSTKTILSRRCFTHFNSDSLYIILFWTDWLQNIEKYWEDFMKYAKIVVVRWLAPWQRVIEWCGSLWNVMKLLQMTCDFIPCFNILLSNYKNILEASLFAVLPSLCLRAACLNINPSNIRSLFASNHTRASQSWCC